jgi:hypothetical protein
MAQEMKKEEEKTSSPQLLNGLRTMLKYHHLLDTEQFKTIMTLSDYKGKQIIRDTIVKSVFCTISTNIYFYFIFVSALGLGPSR